MNPDDFLHLKTIILPANWLGFSAHGADVGLSQLMEEMLAYPQDYLSDNGWLGTNKVEDFGGQPLVYWDKPTD